MPRVRVERTTSRVSNWRSSRLSYLGKSQAVGTARGHFCYEVVKEPGEKRSRLSFRDKESNLDTWFQRPVSYRWTIPDQIFCRSTVRGEGVEPS